MPMSIVTTEYEEIKFLKSTSQSIDLLLVYPCPPRDSAAVIFPNDTSFAAYLHLALITTPCLSH
jgi:hypothetical protein